MSKTILIILVFCILSCNNKKANYTEKLNKTHFEKFDLNRFNENKKDTVYQYISNDTIIKLQEEKTHYKKELVTKNQSYKYVFIYNKTTNSLINESYFFYGMPIGIWKNYNENGNLISSENYDEGFDFTVNDLILLLQKDMQIDLINDADYKSLVISRFSGKRFYFLNSSYYLIQISTIEGNRTIKIDGKTGKILDDNTSYFEE